MVDRFAPITAEELAHLIAVSRRKRPAAVWIKDGVVPNLITGETEVMQIVIAGKRIAYVGKKEPLVDDATRIIDATDRVLLPGYIEPHAHPFQLYHPLTLADYSLERGTTTLIADNMSFFNRMNLDAWLKLMDEFSKHPVKIMWWCRLEPQSQQLDVLQRYDKANLERLLAHPAVIQAGELSHWLALLSGDEEAVQKMTLVKRAKKRIEGHAPGASEETLNALTAAGVTSDHEAITGEEVLRRLRLGLYVPLRHSSIRPDLPVLLEGIKGLRYGWDRLMLTTDGSTPPFLAQGFTDTLIAIALQSGIDPIVAYRMATVNVAAYYGLDEHIGLIAPGRYADIVFLSDINEPTPLLVMAEGELLYDNSARPTQPTPYTSGITIDWQAYDLQYAPAIPTLPMEAIDFRIPWQEGKPYPIIHLINDVITVQVDRVLPVVGGYLTPAQDGLHHVALVDRHGTWITRALISGFAHSLAGLASTYTASMEYLVIGNDYTSMKKALQYVHEHSGIALIDDDGGIIHLPLPIAGGMSTLSMDDLIPFSVQFLQMLKEKGFSHGDAYYCLLFLTSTHLPKLRITRDGVVSIKEQAVILPSVALM